MILHAAREGIPSETSSENRLSADFGSPNPIRRSEETSQDPLFAWGRGKEGDMEPLASACRWISDAQPGWRARDQSAHEDEGARIDHARPVPGASRIPSRGGIRVGLARSAAL